MDLHMDNRPIPQEEWLARSNLRFFKRLEAPMIVPMTVGISNEVILRNMRDYFEVVSRDTYYLSVIARQILADKVSDKIYQEEEVLKAEQEVFKAFEAANSFFDTRIKQAEQVLREAGMLEMSMRAGTVKMYEAWCTSRTATKWLELLKKADQYLTLNFQLWVTGEIGPANQTDGEALAAKLNNERNARVELSKLRRKVAIQFATIRNLVNRVAEQREAENEVRRIEQRERDLIMKKQAAKARAEAREAKNKEKIESQHTSEGSSTLETA